MGEIAGDNFEVIPSDEKYRARYYDPAIGRFISEDPVGFAGGKNFYAYVRNNSINLTDRFGLCPPEKEDKIFTAVSQCVLDMYGVITTGLTYSVGTGNPITSINGEFTGIGLDLYNPGGITSDIRVTNDIKAKDRAYVNSRGTGTYTVQNKPGTTDGYTAFSNPYVNFTANDVTGDRAISTQIFELGNSLYFIMTGRPVGHLGSSEDDPGASFTRCVIKVLRALNQTR